MKNYLIWLTVFTLALFGIAGRTILMGFPTDILGKSMICFHAVFVVVNWLNVVLYFRKEENIDKLIEELQGD